MRKKGDVPTRHEVSEKVEQSGVDLQEKAEDIDQVVEDIETVREIGESVDLGGTADGAEEVESAIDSAEDVTVEVFDDKDEQLEQVQQDNAEYGDDLQERSDGTEADLGKISDAGGRIETTEATNEMIKAKEAAVRDIEFLKEQGRRAQEAHEESERIQREYEARAHSGREG